MSLLRDWCLLPLALGIVRRSPHPSPISTAYLVNLQVSTVSDLMILIGLLYGPNPGPIALTLAA